MPWPPPGFEKPCAQRDLRVLVLDRQPYIHTGDLADWLRRQTENAVPLVGETADAIAAEIRKLGDKALRKCAEQQDDDRGELSA